MNTADAATNVEICWPEQRPDVRAEPERVLDGREDLERSRVG